MLILAHRGLTSHHLENTLAALTSAFDIGADGVEFDVQLSRDLVPVVFHDRSLKRLVGVRRNIDELTWAELKELKQINERYDDFYPIANLSDVLTVMPINKLINIELKETTSMSGKEGIKKVLAAIAPFKHRLRIVISSFDTSILAMVHAEDPAYALGFLIEDRDIWRACVEGDDKIQNISFINPHIRLVDARTAKKLEALGFLLIIWGHKKLGEEDMVMSDGHFALISDVSEELIQKYRK
jgi:glycerophosphoryl diester phosphodiesterase